MAALSLAYLFNSIDIEIRAYRVQKSTPQKYEPTADTHNAMTVSIQSPFGKCLPSPFYCINKYKVLQATADRNEQNCSNAPHKRSKYITQIQKERNVFMEDLQIFSNSEFGEIRTIIKDNEPWFVAKDISDKLGYAQTSNMMKRIDAEDSISSILDGMNMKSILINESGLYSAIIGSKLESARRFKHWVTSEVLPSIRKTGSYNKPMTTAEKIHLLAQGNEELNERVDKVEDKITSIEEETPLYGCEIEEVQKHVRKKGIEVLGGKDSNAYKDGGIRGSVYSDIYKQLKREFGCVATYKSIKRKYLADVHEFIDTYLLPIALAEVVHDTNM